MKNRRSWFIRVMIAPPVIFAVMFLVSLSLAQKVGAWHVGGECDSHGNVVGTIENLPDHVSPDYQVYVEDHVPGGDWQKVAGSDGPVHVNGHTGTFGPLDVSSARSSADLMHIIQVHGGNEIGLEFPACPKPTPTATATATSTNTATMTVTPVPTDTPAPTRTATLRPNTATATFTVTVVPNTPLLPSSTPTAFSTVGVPAYRCPTICLPNTGSGSEEQNISGSTSILEAIGLSISAFAAIAFGLGILLRVTQPRRN